MWTRSDFTQAEWLRDRYYCELQMRYLPQQQYTVSGNTGWQIGLSAGLLVLADALDKAAFFERCLQAHGYYKVAH